MSTPCKVAPVGSTVRGTVTRGGGLFFEVELADGRTVRARQGEVFVDAEVDVAVDPSNPGGTATITAVHHRRHLPKGGSF